MEVTSGTGCGSNGLRITTKEECEAAANELGLSFSQSVIEIDRVDSWPSQCFYPGNPAFGSNVFFNKDTTSTIPCDSDQRKCICKKIGEIVELGLCTGSMYRFQDLQTHTSKCV